MGCRRVLPGAAFLAAGADTIKASAPAVLFLIYHRTDCNCFPADAALTSYAQVRRTSQSPGQWIVEPVAPSGIGGAPLSIAMLVQNAVIKGATSSWTSELLKAPEIGAPRAHDCSTNELPD